MPTVDKLVQGAKQLKVKEVPGYVSKFAGEHWTPDKTRSRLGNWMDRFKVQVREGEIDEALEEEEGEEITN